MITTMIAEMAQMKPHVVSSHMRLVNKETLSPMKPIIGTQRTMAAVKMIRVTMKF